MRGRKPNYIAVSGLLDKRMKEEERGSKELSLASRSFCKSAGGRRCLGGGRVTGDPSQLEDIYTKVREGKGRKRDWGRKKKERVRGKR